jgi:hypothetical protein
MKAGGSYLSRLAARGAMPVIAPMPLLFRSETPAPNVAPGLAPSGRGELRPASPIRRGTVAPLSDTLSPAGLRPTPFASPTPTTSTLPLAPPPAATSPAATAAPSDAAGQPDGVVPLPAAEKPDRPIAAMREQPAAMSIRDKLIQAQAAHARVEPLQPKRFSSTQSAVPPTGSAAGSPQAASGEVAAPPPIRFRSTQSGAAATATGAVAPQSDVAASQGSPAAEAPPPGGRVAVPLADLGPTSPPPASTSLGAAVSAARDRTSAGLADAAPLATAQGISAQPSPAPPQSAPSPGFAALERLASRWPVPLDPPASRAPSGGVTIGRLEVRVSPPPPAPLPARPRAPAAVARIARGFPSFGLAQG